MFQEKEAFDAALEAGMIPVGSLVVKTYDAIEMAGGPFDAALSDESENAVQNKIIKEQVDRLDQEIANALALRASLTEFGLGKICPADVTDVTEANGLMLGAFEKNPSVDGTLANGIEGIKNILSQKNNGYFALADGLKICFGYATPSEGRVTVNFPVQYSNTPFVTASLSAYQTEFMFSCIITNATNQGASFFAGYLNQNQVFPSGALISWISIGY